MDKARHRALSLDPVECKDELILSFPIVQGTRNQHTLAKLGKFAGKKLDAELVHQALDALKAADIQQN